MQVERDEPAVVVGKVAVGVRTRNVGFPLGDALGVDAVSQLQAGLNR